MTTQKEKEELAAPLKEQITYANVLAIGAWTGIALMTITYILYITGIMPPHVDLALVVNNWDKGVNEYMRITNSPDGWNWALLLHKGDFLNFVGMALLALLTIVCYLIILKGYVVRKDRTYALICIAEIVVLSLAASGVLGTGGH